MPSVWLRDLLDSPCPYIYGCLYETIRQIPLTIDNEIIRVDLDLSTIEGSNDTSRLFPLNLRQTLESSLEYLKRFRLTKLNSNLINIAVSEACLYVFTELFYRLPDFFKRDEIGIDLPSGASKENRLGYDFRSDEFLILQPTSTYVTFLNDFIHGLNFE
jgi:hypothetical protein